MSSGTGPDSVDMGNPELNLEDVHSEARRAISENRPRDAVALLTKVLAENPGDAECLSLLGAAYAADNNYPLALDCFNRSLAIRPTARVFYNLAALYRRQGFTAPAKRALRRAVELDPSYERARKMLAEIEIAESQG